MNFVVILVATHLGSSISPAIEVPVVTAIAENSEKKVHLVFSAISAIS